MTDLHDAVVDLEAELDATEAAVERCRKTSLVARAVAAGGAALLLLGVWRGDAVLFVTGVAAALGGMVLAGSTRTTRAQLVGRMAAIEARRAEIVDRLVALGPTAARDIG